MIQYPLVFVPALGSDSRLWQPVIDRIHNLVECTVIRGSGDSIESMADSVLAQAPDRFYLAGNSMGGYVSLEIALRQTDRVHGLVLLNTSAREAPVDRRKNSIELIEMAEAGQFDTAVERISRSVASPGRSDVTATAASMAHALGVGVFKSQQLAVLSRIDRRLEIHDIKIPTLVVAGDADLITPAELSQELVESIPDSELSIFSGCGHLSPLEQPAKVASSILHWLLRVDAGAEAAAAAE
jgi:pimeloyl-ACP methyl ester carboxylesterase